MVFCGKTIVIGVCGSVAAFKVAGWVSALAKDEAILDIIMTESARQFITPLTFASLSGRRVYDAMFDGKNDGDMAHIELGRNADLLVIAPSSANTIAKLACGMADNLLTTTALVTHSPKLLFPAMNSRMFENKITQCNLEKLRNAGWQIIDPATGMMACKEFGAGRLVEWEIAYEEMARALSKQDLAEKRVLITAGPTRESIDPARFLSNRSSGKMGYALARAAVRRGAKVTLISGESALAIPHNVNFVRVESAEEMFDAVMKNNEQADIIIKSAAVSDYRSSDVAEHKMKKETIEPILQLTQNPDILRALGERKRAGQILVGFAAESQNLEAEGKRKLQQKKLDLIAVNNICSEAAGFASDTNQVILIDAEKSVTLPLLSKEDTAERIIDKITCFLR